MTPADSPEAVEKIDAHRDDLQDLAESDLPISDIAATLLEAGADE